MLPAFLLQSITDMKSRLRTLPGVGDGEEFAPETADWVDRYVRHLCVEALRGVCETPGEAIGDTQFDLRRGINWDVRWYALNSDDDYVSLGDKAALDASIEGSGAHGFIVVACRAIYVTRNHVMQQQCSVSQYMITSATLIEILFLLVDGSNKDVLSIHAQGRNSNGRSRRPKYELDLEEADSLIVDRITFPPLTAQ